MEIYDRIYYKKYSDVTYQQMFFTDKELFNLDANKIQTDVLALQKELKNRLYRLPKSTKTDGKLDGIYREETKNALLDWQNRNNIIL